MSSWLMTFAGVLRFVIIDEVPCPKLLTVNG
jgi:hypothetical protein